MFANRVLRIFILLQNQSRAVINTTRKGHQRTSNQLSNRHVFSPFRHQVTKNVRRTVPVQIGRSFSRVNIIRNQHTRQVALNITHPNQQPGLPRRFTRHTTFHNRTFSTTQNIRVVLVPRPVLNLEVRQPGQTQGILRIMTVTDSRTTGPLQPRHHSSTYHTSAPIMTTGHNIQGNRNIRRIRRILHRHHLLTKTQHIQILRPNRAMTTRMQSSSTVALNNRNQNSFVMATQQMKRAIRRSS